MTDYRGAASESGRAKHLLKKREIELQEIENKRKKIEQDCHVENITDKFAKAPTTFIDPTSNSARVGLKTIDEFKAILNSTTNIRDSKLSRNAINSRKQTEHDERAKLKKKAKSLKKLSFGDDDEDDNDANDNNKDSNDAAAKAEAADKTNETLSETKSTEVIENNACVPKTVRRLEKNPNVDTSFLPDREREDLEEQIRNEIRQEWLLKQQRLKDEKLIVVFSYWDGFGHRRQLEIKKGKTIYEFLQKALEVLRVDFMELKSTSADQLMYIKEDLILPHHYSFYDFIVRKTRGKSGPLFNFDVHDDVRLYHDARIEKDESHAGKVLLRSWYERHKHIFPASRWEPFDPTKDYEKYTICDKRN